MSTISDVVASEHHFGRCCECPPFQNVVTSAHQFEKYNRIDYEAAPNQRLQVATTSDVASAHHFVCRECQPFRTLQVPTISYVLSAHHFRRCDYAHLIRRLYKHHIRKRVTVSSVRVHHFGCQECTSLLQCAIY